MGTIKNLDDIEREKKARENAELKEQIAQDTSDVLSKINKKFKDNRNKNRSILTKIVRFVMWFLLSIAIFIFCLNLLLFNIWLLKWLIQQLFNLQ
jgi:hypothetical protein